VNIHQRIYGADGITQVKQSEEAQRMQQTSLGALYTLVNRSIQVLTFLEVLYVYRLLQLLPPTVPQEHINLMCRKLFKDCLIENDTAEAMKDIITMKDIMKLIIGTNPSENTVKQAIEILAKKCSDYFKEYDLKEIIAYDHLTRAGLSAGTADYESVIHYFIF
jgi:hypothetical protein